MLFHTGFPSPLIYENPNGNKNQLNLSTDFESMLLQIRILRYGSFSRFNSFHLFLNSLRSKKPYLSMATESGHTKKRPTCPNCSKPIKICLCARLKTPVYQNSIAVTILQHSLEKKHPLNSTRIATIGLKDVSVSAVSDVNFLARFFIRFLESEEDYFVSESHSEDERSDFGVFEKPSNFGAGEYDEGLCPSSLLNGEVSESRMDSLEVKKRDIVANGAVSGRSEGAVFTFTIEKYGAIKSFSNQCQKSSNFDHHLFDSKNAAELLSKGFVVKKLQTKQLNGATVVDLEEFDIEVPPGSILLFPSEKSVGIEAIDFEVKNLIVLDGTWAKAKRMYNENPWLKFLPHVKLDIIDKLSVYSEVRHQPRPGYLSTIESIVYALKAFGENSDKLDDLLDLFESMVEDQRQCRDERLSRSSVSTKKQNS